MNAKQAYDKGWAASQRTKTYDLGAAEDRFIVKYGDSTNAGMFAAGWTDHASDYAKYTNLKEPKMNDTEPVHYDLISPCEHCGAEWQTHDDGSKVMDHKPGCAYIEKDDKEAALQNRKDMAAAKAGQEIKVDIKFTVKEELLSDILITAFDGAYGGAWYWAEPANDNWLLTNNEPDITRSRWLRCDIQEQEASTDDREGKVELVDHLVISQGIARILNGEVKASQADMLLRAVVEEDGGYVDADLADCIVQAGIFGELVYG